MKRKKLLIAAGLALSAACYAQDNVTVNTASGQKVGCSKSTIFSA